MTTPPAAITRSARISWSTPRGRGRARWRRWRASRSPIALSAGVLVAVRGRHCNMVVNRLHSPGDGDIVVPQRQTTVLGTSSWPVDDPDDLGVSADHVAKVVSETSTLLPALRDAQIRATWSAARPLVGDRGAGKGRGLPRGSRCFDHAAGRHPDRGLRHDRRRRGDEVAGDGRGRGQPRLRQARHRPAVSDGRGDAAALTRPGTPDDRIGRPRRSRRRRLTRQSPRPPAEAAPPALRWRISRFKAGDGKPHFDEFEYTPEPGATVLDVLIEIRRHQDPSLVLRHSCMHASCGTCGIRVNGREVSRLRYEGRPDCRGRPSRSNRSRISVSWRTWRRTWSTSTPASRRPACRSRVRSKELPSSSRPKA